MASNNDFRVLLQAVLDSNSIGQDDINKIQKVISKYHLNLTADLDKASVIAEIKKIVPQLEAELKKMTGVDIQINDSALLKAFNQIEKQAESTAQKLNKIQLLRNEGKFTSQISDVTADYNRLSSKTKELQADFKTLNDLGKVLNTSADADELRQSYEQFNTTLQKVKNSISVMDNEGLMYADQKKIDSLAESVLKFRDNNTKMSKDLKRQFTDIYDDLINGTKLTDKEVAELTARFTKLKLQVREAGQLGQSFGDRMKNAFKKFSEWGFATNIITSIVSKLREAVNELTEIDTLLTEISKANDKLSSSQLADIGESSFEVASKYGKKAIDYLSGVQEASRAGYENAEAIAELSTAIQGAGDVTADVANSYVIATDKAYKLGGNVEKLTEIFDGSNKITNLNAVNMTELAEAMTIVGSTASSFGIDVDETTAAIATMSATTQQSGSEVARAFRAILLNIRQVVDSEEDIDAEGLTKYEKACAALGVSLKETKNGITSLRDPMEVLKELSIEYNKLAEDDIKRTNLLNAVGSKLRSTQLDALLRQWDTYEKMLQQYADGTGSMMTEAEKTANSLQGRINSVSNTWIDFINNLAKSDEMEEIVDFFNNIISLLDKLTQYNDMNLISILAGIGGSYGLSNLNLD